MDFELSEEQRLLKDSVERLTTQRYDFEARKKYMKEADGWSRALWKQYVDLGLTALPFAEEHGGIGGGPVETMIVMEAFGRALALEPYFATRHARRQLPAARRERAARADVLPKVAAGETLLAFAHTERQARYDLADVAATAKKDGAGYVLNGEKSLVLHGDVADKIDRLGARLGRAQRSRTASGCSWSTPRQTASRAAAIRRWTACAPPKSRSQNVKVGADAVIGEPGNAFPLIEQVVDIAIAALAAEAVGAMSAMHEITVDYLKQRKQFGVPIGNFQVLQHRAGDMLIALEQARSMAMLATMMTEEQNAEERRKSIVGRQGADRPLGQDRRPVRDPAARRHRHDDGVQGRPLLQARHHDRYDVRRRRPSSRRARPHGRRDRCALTQEIRGELHGHSGPAAAQRKGGRDRRAREGVPRRAHHPGRARSITASSTRARTAGRCRRSWTS